VGETPEVDLMFANALLDADRAAQPSNGFWMRSNVRRGLPRRSLTARQAEALDVFERLARTGLPEAQLMLAWYHCDGIGVSLDPIEAGRLYHLATSRGPQVSSKEWFDSRAADVFRRLTPEEKRLGREKEASK
jgi:TPR repeat protein